MPTSLLPLAPPATTARRATIRVGYAIAFALALAAHGPRLPAQAAPARPSAPGAAADNDLADSGASPAYRARDSATALAYPEFSLALFRAMARQTPDTNVFISPASAAFALAMTASGTAGTTWSAMARTLGVGSISPERLGAANAAALRSLTGQTAVTLTIANSIWADSGRPFLPAFLDGTRRWYDADVTSLVLHGPAAESRINAWVAHATAGRIASILPDTLPDSAGMVLINAVYFKGRWRGRFDSAATAPHAFTIGDGRHVTRRLMNRRTSLLYLADTGLRIVRLPYRGGRLAMYVVLPDSTQRLANVVARLTPARWSRWMQSLATREVQIELPRFRLEYGATLNASLDTLGMGIAFRCDSANFSRMLPANYLRRHPTCIDRVLQRTFVDVNEEGTEAAAVTAVTIAITASAARYVPPPIEFIVDHPFLVAIRDDRTGLLLFLGQITDPKQP
jgi:serpin B